MCARSAVGLVRERQGESGGGAVGAAWAWGASGWRASVRPGPGVGCVRRRAGASAVVRQGACGSGSGSDENGRPGPVGRASGLSCAVSHYWSTATLDRRPREPLPRISPAGPHSTPSDSIAPTSPAPGMDARAPRTSARLARTDPGPDPPCALGPCALDPPCSRTPRACGSGSPRRHPGPALDLSWTPRLDKAARGRLGSNGCDSTPARLPRPVAEGGIHL